LGFRGQRQRVAAAQHVAQLEAVGGWARDFDLDADGRCVARTGVRVQRESHWRSIALRGLQWRGQNALPQRFICSKRATSHE
jgi:hypothetical protein